ncbi:WD repeat-containing protein 60 [Phytophthora boehmeriae]|uniref:WD repeat-containing protein 60 n=1 Tax=Phytophthora boehmeriae TaxID=109152 RepID=A0A8T1WZB1_9STRA|nr:WD repeat-containing protein 60 [Phytophthora boehmeriae]
MASLQPKDEIEASVLSVRAAAALLKNVPCHQRNPAAIITCLGEFDPSKAAAKKTGRTRGKRKRRPSVKQLLEKRERDADNSKILNLTLDVNDLHQQIRDCLLQKSLRETRMLVAREQFHSHCFRSVEHFFQVFRHGYPQVLFPDDQRFLSVMLDEKIAMAGGMTGTANFFEQWQRYKQLFQVRRVSNFSLQLVSSDTNGCVIRCTGEFEGVVTAAALETVFPHILKDKALVERVLHRCFVCPTWTLLHLDSNGRFALYDAFSDVFNAMNVLLDFDPVHVARLMANAAIKDGSVLPAVDSSISAIDDCGDQSAANRCDQDDSSDEVTNTSPSKSSIDFILS